MKYSFIIPTYNRIQSLIHCIESIQNQNSESIDYEIIVVNDGGEENNIENIININQENKGPATARNNGAKVAQGEYLVFIDDDCRLDTNWLQEINKNIDKKLIITGYTINNIESIWSDASQTLVNFLHFQWIGTPWHFFASNNLVISKNDFENLNGFNESFPLAAGEDREFCLRAKLLNLEFKQVFEAKVYHYHKLNFVTFCKQHINYGKGAFYYNKILSKLNMQLKIQPFSFYFQMFFYPFNQEKFIKGVAISFLICFSQVLNLIGFLMKKVKG